MATFDVRDLLGKIVYPKKDIVANWSYPGNPKNPFVIKAGKPIGVLYSVITFQGKQYFDFKSDPFYYSNAAKEKYFVEYDINLFDTSKFLDQGVPDLKEKGAADEEQRKKDDEGTIVYYLQKWGLPIIGIAAAAYLAKAFIQRPSK